MGKAIIWMFLAVLPLFIIVESSFVLDPVGGQAKWIVYFHGDFDKEPLCAVLKCRRHEACLVRNENAVCVKKHKFHQVDGQKFHHKTGEEMSNGLMYDARRVALGRNGAVEVEQDAPRFVQKQKKKHQHHTHSQRHEEPTAVCDDKDLLKMGGRLLQWFSDVHAHIDVADTLPLPKHHVSCRADVSWMFQQWDGDNDGELSAEELRPLDNDEKEKCLSVWLDRCDADGDGAISLDEWCDGFAWADDVRHEPSCHRHRRAVDPHQTGVWHPRCNTDGFYRTEQCAADECWCVDKFGREFDRSRVAKRRPDCGQYAEEMDEDEPFGPDAEL